MALPQNKDSGPDHDTVPEFGKCVIWLKFYYCRKEKAYMFY